MDKKSNKGRGGRREGAGRKPEKPVVIEAPVRTPVEVYKALATSNQIAPSVRLRAAQLWREASGASEPDPLEILIDGRWEPTGASFEATEEQRRAWNALKTANERWLRVGRPAR